jgi:phosphinothricin acetyltransferase
MTYSIPIVIEAATEADLPGILDIYNDAILNTTSVYQYEPHTLDMRIRWFHEKRKLGLPVLVAKHEERVTGFATWGQFRDWPAYKYSVEHSVYVHPDFRRQGIATALLTQLIELARQRQVHALIAGIDADNAVSIHLHKEFGFSQVAHFHQVGYKFGRWLDLVFLQLILSSSFQPTET